MCVCVCVSICLTVLSVCLFVCLSLVSVNFHLLVCVCVCVYAYVTRVVGSMTHPTSNIQHSETIRPSRQPDRTDLFLELWMILDDKLALLQLLLLSLSLPPVLRLLHPQVGRRAHHRRAVDRLARLRQNRQVSLQHVGKRTFRGDKG